MIEIRKGFQNYQLMKEYQNLPLKEYQVIEGIHKYDKQRLKSLLNELRKDSKRDVIWKCE